MENPKYKRVLLKISGEASAVYSWVYRSALS